MRGQRQRRPIGRSESRSGRTGPVVVAVAATSTGIGPGLRARLRYLLFLGMVIGALGVVLRGSTFRVDEVDVTGALLIDRSRVIAVSGLVGQNPFLVDTRLVRQHILDLGVPERVSISFQLPNVAMIEIVERRPAYRWKVDSTVYLVATDGTILAPTNREGIGVVVVDADHRPVKVGEQVDPRILQEADYLVHVLPSVGLSPRYVLHSAELGIVVPTGDGLQVAFGDSEHLEAKVQAVGPSLEAARQHQPRPSLVDVQVPERPFFR